MAWDSPLGAGTIGRLGDLDGFAVDRGSAVGVEETDKVTQALDVASGIVRRATSDQVISQVANDDVWIDGRGARVLFLPQMPVVSVAKVVVDGDEWTEGTEYEVNLDLGYLEAQACRCFPAGAKRCEITYTHGYNPIPAEIQDIVYGLAQRLLASPAGQGVQAESKTIGSATHSVTYEQGGEIGLSDLELAVIRSLRLR